jgi:xanthine/uracil/vitamin C permease (AzgA family)
MSIVEGEAATESGAINFNEMMMSSERLDLSDEVSFFSPFSRPLVRQRIHDLYKNLTLSEISGSLGDLGTFIPLYVALCRQGLLYPTAALFFAGVSNVLTGFFWDLPMPVQPMKAIAAVALVEGLSQEQVTTAGIWMALFLFLLGFTNAIGLIHRVVPQSVVWGMQLGVGANLAIKGLVMVSQLTWFDAMDCIVLAIACALMCAIFLAESVETSANNHPVGVYMFLLGSILALVQLLSETNGAPSSALSQTGIVDWALRDVTWKDWKVGLLQGALPQLPLSTLVSLFCINEIKPVASIANATFCD